MTGFLVDTNVISEIRRGTRAHPSVVSWFDAQQGADLWLSVLTIGEIRHGIARLRRRDPESAMTIARWLDSVVSDFGDRILPVTTEVAERWAELGLEAPVPVIDGLLAATAMEHDLTIATRNVADVERTGVPFVNPWST
ncbi:MAG: type II toxin-antitoxin system VapC family toxin [Actinomycetota bacterium]